MTPNIVFIVCHDLGRHLSVYGQSAAPTPALERLAREGCVFDRFFSTSSMCSPSRASIVTGRYPHQVGVFGLTNAGWWDLDPGTRCTAHFLGKAGYRTTLVGMQHEASHWSRLGYQERIEQPGPHPQPAVQAGKQAAEFLLAQGPRHGRQPFYLNIGFFQPHRHGCYSGCGGIDPAAVRLPPYLPDTPGVREDVAHLESLTQELDRGVQEVLDALDAAGLFEQTIVVFTADHGLPLPRAKCTLYDAGIGVAAIVRWPGRIRAASRCQALASHVDWQTTLLSAAGVPAPATAEGRDLLFRLDQTGADERSIVAEATYHGRFNPMRCIRTATHKLIRNYHPDPHRHSRIEDNPDNGIRALADYPASTWDPPPLWELYDVTADAGERHNLAGNEAAAAVQARLTAELDDWARRTADPVHRIYATFGGRMPDGILPPCYGV